MVVALVRHHDAVALAVLPGKMNDPGIFLGAEDDVGAAGMQEFLEGRAARFI
jgi:hypothetical protein